MKIADLKEGDRLEDHRRGAVLVIKKIVFCGSCPCGWGEISYEETSKNAHVSHVHSPRKCCKTFRQFERLRFLRRVDDCVRPLGQGDPKQLQDCGRKHPQPSCLCVMCEVATRFENIERLQESRELLRAVRKIDTVADNRPERKSRR